MRNVGDHSYPAPTELGERNAAHSQRWWRCARRARRRGPPCHRLAPNGKGGATRVLASENGCRSCSRDLADNLVSIPHPRGRAEFGSPLLLLPRSCLVRHRSQRLRATRVHRTRPLPRRQKRQPHPTAAASNPTQRLCRRLHPSLRLPRLPNHPRRQHPHPRPSLHLRQSQSQHLLLRRHPCPRPRRRRPRPIHLSRPRTLRRRRNPPMRAMLPHRTRTQRSRRCPATRRSGPPPTHQTGRTKSRSAMRQARTASGLRTAGSQWRPERARWASGRPRHHSAVHLRGGWRDGRVPGSELGRGRHRGL